MRFLVYLSTNTMLPRTMIITISISVLAVLMLAGFVLYMWRTQEKSADIAKEVNRITDSIGAGVVNYIANGDGMITYGSKGFYEIIGYTRDELKKSCNMSFFRLLAKPYDDEMRNMKISEDFSLSKEMKINTAFGERWILLKGNSEKRKGKIITVSAVMVDITENKELNEKLAIEQERYRLATELSNDVIMSYSVSNDTLKISDNFREFYGGNTSIPNFSKNKVWEKGFIYQEDIEKAAELVRIISLKGGKIDQQLRVRDVHGNYVWCRLICMPVKTEGIDGHKEYVGKLINIDMHKKQLGLLEKKASRDPLTGAYNKEYTKALIDKYITDNPDNPGMLLMVDIDHFKDINDNYGHAMGDQIIIEVVRQVTKAFRSGDIIGRIGGDEFVVYVCNVRNPEDQIKQAKKLQEVLRMPFESDGVTINKSASIGVALYPGHADSYDKLIRLADEALYKAKGNGRDVFIIYGNE